MGHTVVEIWQMSMKTHEAFWYAVYDKWMDSKPSFRKKYTHVRRYA